jgi:hypothetical protein
VLCENRQKADDFFTRWPKIRPHARDAEKKIAIRAA